MQAESNFVDSESACALALFCHTYPLLAKASPDMGMNCNAPAVSKVFHVEIVVYKAGLPNSERLSK